MKVLHLSDTPLSGSPIRISQLLNDHSDVESRHLVWNSRWGFRDFDTDLISSKLERFEIEQLFEWADVIHYHNRYKRQEIFKKWGMEPPKKPSVIQIHSPRNSENFKEELASGIPLAIIAQYHVREWPELRFIVPNVVDIESTKYAPMIGENSLPVVSYAPSNCNMKGWDDKGYNVTAPHLKRLALDNKIVFQLIVGQPHRKCLELKRQADIGIDEIVTGSYHLSSLEYLAMGIPCLANIDEQTRRVLTDLTGADKIPWEICQPHELIPKLRSMIMFRSYKEDGVRARRWMEKYWNPGILCSHYINMYRSL